MIFVLTGNGKGKTTGAIGMGIRAAGAGRRVLMVQFLKAGSYSEEKIIARIKNFQFKSFGRRCFILPQQEIDQCPQYKKCGVQAVSEQDKKLAYQGWELAQRAVLKKKADFLILDEMNLALKYGLLDKKEVMDFLSAYGQKIDVVLTGRYCLKKIIALADLVSDVRPVKHYFRLGKGQRKGIEF